MKENKPKNWLSFITGSGTYQEAKFADDADLMSASSTRTRATCARAVGQPQIETVEDSKDGKTRWIRLRIPVDEGLRYRIGTFEIADNTAVRTEVLRALFKMQEGEFYNDEEDPQGHREGEGDLRHRRLLAVGARRRHPCRAASIPRPASRSGPSRRRPSSTSR